VNPGRLRRRQRFTCLWQAGEPDFERKQFSPKTPTKSRELASNSTCLGQQWADPGFQNPCDNPALRKLFRAGKPAGFKILGKDVVDEIIFRTPNPRNRLLLELIARAGMRVGEVLKLRPKDIEDRKAIIRAPKSGKEVEAAFLP